MKKQTRELFDKLRQNLPTPQEKICEFTFYDPIGIQINEALENLNILEVDLHDVIMKNVFKGIDYYSIVGLVPMWVRNDGHSQEGCLSKEDFETLVQANDNELTHRLLYYYDCEMLMSSFQNRTSVLVRLINKIYEILTPNLSRDIKEYDDVAFGISTQGIDVYTYLNSLIITLASSFDIITKIAYELQEMSNVNFLSYPNMKSANITYGKRKWLGDNLMVENTLFAKKEAVCIRTIESLRDEIIHNGSLDFHYALYHGLINDNIEQWIFFPDLNESGTLKNIKARKKFYPDCTRTFNVVLPPLLFEVIRWLEKTLHVLISTFECPYNDDKQSFMNFRKEISGWYGKNFSDSKTIESKDL